LCCAVLCCAVLCCAVLCCVCSEFSEAVELMTSCGVPAPPANPELVKSGVTMVCVQWQRPQGSPREDDIGYVLEMEEMGSVSGNVYTHTHTHSTTPTQPKHHHRHTHTRRAHL